METHFNDFFVPKKEVAEYLMALGVKLDTTLAPAFVLAGSQLEKLRAQ